MLSCKTQSRQFSDVSRSQTVETALFHVYLKISEKASAFVSIYINLEVKRDLSWFLEHIRASSGVFMFHAIDWDPRTDADFTILCDACPLGMGFWTELLLLGFYSAVPTDAPKDTIFFWEATCVLSALEWFCTTRRTTMAFNKFLKCTFLIDKVWLIE
ncbi:hypothetical protein B0H10DRAFT_2242864 [Mycena sp. CBHHK59/15]|nr:hypothetical protein B0H10DRAFT_2242864 [Mycena sp. CBHHK59/15]